MIFLKKSSQFQYIYYNKYDQKCQEVFLRKLLILGAFLRIFRG